MPMRSSEDYCAAVFARRDAYLARQKRRRRLLGTAAPALCAAVLCAILLPGRLGKEAEMPDGYANTTGDIPECSRIDGADGAPDGSKHSPSNGGALPAQAVWVTGGEAASLFTARQINTGDPTPMLRLETAQDAAALRRALPATPAALWEADWQQQALLLLYWQPAGDGADPTGDTVAISAEVAGDTLSVTLPAGSQNRTGGCLIAIALPKATAQAVTHCTVTAAPY